MVDTSKRRRSDETVVDLKQLLSGCVSSSTRLQSGGGGAFSFLCVFVPSRSFLRWPHRVHTAKA
jgi:hypothetical protein